MPLRGLLFKKIFASREERAKIEKRQLAQHFKKESGKIAKIKKKRIEEEGRANLRRILADEKTRLKAARSTRKVSRLEGFLKKEAERTAKAATKFAIKQAKKRAARVRAGKPVFGKGNRKKRKKKGQRKRKKGRR